MNISEVGSVKRTRIFSTLIVIWVSLFLATGLLIPVIAVVPPGPTADLLKPIFLIVGVTMMLLALLIVVLCVAGFAAIPRASESDDTPWPFVLVAGFLFAGLLASGIVSQTADHMGTSEALVEMGILLGLFVLPFAVLAIIVPGIVHRYSPDHARLVKSCGYVAAMLIDLVVWSCMAGNSVLARLKDVAIIWAALLTIGYLIVLAVRRRRRNVRS